MGGRSDIGAELAARHIMASAVLADFRSAVTANQEDGAKAPDWPSWAERLATALDGMLDEIGEPETGAGIVYPGGGWISGPST
jgi:hypothetical protein